MVKKVLVVEDDEPVRFALTRFLEKENFVLLSAKDGEEGWRIFQEHKADIFAVIFDVKMPNMSGDELLEKIRQSGSDVMAIAMTGFAPPDKIAKIRKLGVEKIMTKPLNLLPAV